MTYKEFIKNIIDTRGQWNPPTSVWVGHHILPVCVGGLGNYRSKDKNIIWLILQEHYEAHKLLAIENPNNVSLQRAWFMMSNVDGVTISAEEYAMSRTAAISAMSGDNHPDVSGKNNPMYGIHRYGKDNPNYGNRKLAGENHFYYGKKRDERTCKKVSKTRIERGVAKGVNNPRARKVKCIELNIVFDTGSEAAKVIGGAKSGVCRACKQNIVYKGYHWCYNDSEV